MNLRYSLGRPTSGENSSFVFSAWSPSNGKFCSEAQNRKQEVNRNDFPNSPKANHCTCYGWELRWGVNPPLKGGTISICQLCTVNSLLPKERNSLSASFLSGGGTQGRTDSEVKDTQTATRKTQVPTWMLTLFFESVPLKALFLKGKYSHDSPLNFLITVHGINISLEFGFETFRLKCQAPSPHVNDCSVSG